MCMFSAPTIEQPEVEDPQYLRNPYLEETAGNLGFLNLQKGGQSGLQASPEAAAIGFGGQGGKIGASASNVSSSTLSFGGTKTGVIGRSLAGDRFHSDDGDPTTGGQGSRTYDPWDAARGKYYGWN